MNTTPNQATYSHNARVKTTQANANIRNTRQYFRDMTSSKNAWSRDSPYLSAFLANTYALLLGYSTSGYGSRSTTSTAANPARISASLTSCGLKKMKSIDTVWPRNSSTCLESSPIWNANNNRAPGCKTRFISSSARRSSTGEKWTMA